MRTPSPKILRRRAISLLQNNDVGAAFSRDLMLLGKYLNCKRQLGKSDKGADARKAARAHQHMRLSWLAVALAALLFGRCIPSFIDLNGDDKLDSLFEEVIGDNAPGWCAPRADTGAGILCGRRGRESWRKT